MDIEEHLSPASATAIKHWLKDEKYTEYRAEIKQLIANRDWQELEDSFFTVIPFGTGGRRGKTGVGPNRINRVTLGESAQALCEYALAQDSEAGKKGVTIACDTRLTSQEFSNYCAQICAANGFKVYQFSTFRATPELSFAVRHLGCAIGIVISASHNPPRDNGFKAYWSDGGQLVAPHDKAVLTVASGLETIKVVSYEEARAQGTIVICDELVDDAYVKAVVDESLSTERDLAIVYSPLHGAGQSNVIPVLKAAGFNYVSLVEAQMTPDGNFPTVANNKPNPEEPGANDLAIQQLLAEKADIAVTNDPDADRISVIVLHDNQAIMLSGNQTLALATNFALQKQRASLTNKDYIVKTIVTTDLMEALAAYYKIKCYGDIPVGIKFIAALMSQKAGHEHFIIGGEESLGFTLGEYIREKDGAIGALIIAEYAAELKKQGKTLIDELAELYHTHGVYRELLESTYYEGAAGFETMQDIMNKLRREPPKTIQGRPLTVVTDYQQGIRRDLTTNTAAETTVPAGNTIAFEFSDRRCRISVRPSGTEPKIKLYIQWYEAYQGGNALEQAKALDETIRAIATEFKTFL